MTGPVQWVVVQIRLGRKHQQLRQQGIQKKAPAAESPRVLEAAREQAAPSMRGAAHAERQAGPLTCDPTFLVLLQRKGEAAGEGTSGRSGQPWGPTAAVFRGRARGGVLTPSRFWGTVAVRTELLHPRHLGKQPAQGRRSRNASQCLETHAGPVGAGVRGGGGARGRRLPQAQRPRCTTLASTGSRGKGGSGGDFPELSNSEEVRGCRGAPRPGKQGAQPRGQPRKGLPLGELSAANHS